MDLGLGDKVAVVLASSSGLGFASARSLLEEGARVALSGRGSRPCSSCTKQLRFGAFSSLCLASARSTR